MSAPPEKSLSSSRQTDENRSRREAILEVASYAADRFLRAESWQACLGNVLQRLSQAADVACVWIFENHAGPYGEPRGSLRYHYLAPGARLRDTPAAFQNLPLEGEGLESLIASLETGMTISGSARLVSGMVRALLPLEGVKSFVLVPVFGRDRPWGFLGLSDNRQERDWTRDETEALRAVASILGAAIVNERIRAELVTSESELRAIFSVIRHAAFIVDADGRYLRVVPTNADLLLRPPRDLLGRTFKEVLPADQAAGFLRAVRNALKEQRSFSLEHVLAVGSPARETWFNSVVSPLSGETALVVSHDITERKRSEAAVAQSEARYRHFFENLLESVFQSTPEGRFISANPAMVQLLGYKTEEDLLKVEAAANYATQEDRNSWLERMAKEVELRNFEVTLKRKDGSLIPVLLNARALRDARGEVQCYEGTITDITDRKRLESQLILLANRDPLTNLFNRRRFQEELELQLKQTKRFGMQSALLWVDVDRFKEVNDNMGHRSGDELLVELARLLEGLLRGHDVLARLGGDEFAILMPQVDALQAQVVANRVLESVHKRTFVVEGHPIGITVSIGIALFPEHATTADKLLVHADLAMYRAKEEGRNRFSFYEVQEDRPEHVGFRLTWIRHIRRALDQNQFVLFVQPILDFKTDRVTQHELLLRMDGVGEELASPEAFLDVAVKFNLIQEIDRWVVRQAVRTIREQVRAGRSPVLEINLSAKAFVESELLSLLESELRTIDPARLIVEVTEISTLDEFAHAQKFIARLRKLGCRCALDDFGVGLTSFQHLRHLPLDFLKIDGSLIEGLAQNPVNQHIVQAIGHLTRSLGIRTIAECVDGPETIALLKDYGIDLAQGYTIGEPRPLGSVFP